VAGALGDDQPEIVVLEELYGADVDDVISAVAESGADENGVERILVVGHNPTMEQLAYDIQAEPTQPWGDHLPTSGIAVFAIESTWSDVRLHTAKLVNWDVPRG
jgi:phosphohistidine phosphatase SixA